MLFEYELTIPANTPANSPVRLDMRLARGIIHDVGVDFRAGARHEVFVMIRRAVHQVFPANPDGYFKGDFFPIRYSTWEPLEEAPYKLEAYGWSPGTTYAHVVTIRLNIDPREVLIPPDASAGIIRRIGQLIFGGRP